ncbi:hypothetical protein HELRODRAFT_194484 [Helobdella robusta]|uniref:PKD/Chitinase domain-containing protein n=1 Tax=Helobdella robusta TaxID=6412 RepID=T1FW40_HELRO|nr:hypothetical protein HELRODRAFT_194484 [Helobdella robusta]ESN91934.1 hypothetical protein HELRODRAFT_194484 [Helobdella robusta]
MTAVRLNKAPVVTVMPSEQKLSQLNDLVIDGSGSSDDDRIVSYKWDLISGPITSFPVDEGEATFTSPTLKLKGGLAPGFYMLKLTVTDSDGVSSAAYANVTVIKEVDYPPKANAGNNIIVSLPINSVTLNGNMSSDDKKIVSYEWTKVSDELATDMVGVRTPYLALGNLQVGDYTFKLTVKDQSNQTDQADVHVIVKPAQNQAPVANAGLNQTVVLPVDLVVLNASNSTDDKKIISYQWIVISGPPGDTKIGNSNQSVARLLSPRLGVYVLQVKVTDEEHLYSVASSVITVKQNPNAPPVANAGGDFAVDIQTGMLVKINGSKSRDDRGIVSYFWQKGQNNPAVGEVVPGSDHSPILLLINLVPGLYTFTLKVVDVEGLVDTDYMVLTVNKDIKQDYMVDVVLGVDVDKFTDVDKNALKLHLEMMFPSMLANVTSCKVIFHRVTSELDTNRIFLQMYVQTSDKKLSKNSDALPHGINNDEDDGDVNDRNIGKGMEWKMRDSDEIVRVMKMKYTEGYILEFPLVRILPVVCHSACSGHGKCDQVTKLCQCDTFWTSNWLRAHYGIQESNCEWSLLYVIIVIVVIVVVVVALIWCVVCAIRRRFFRKDFKAGKAQSSLKRRHRYKLLEEAHNGVGPVASSAHLNGTLNQTHPTKLRVSRSVVSDSDTSSEETVFINNNKLNTNNVNNNKSSVNSADHIIEANGNQDIGGAVNSDDDNDDDDDDDLFNVVGIDDDNNDGDNEKRPLNKKDGDDYEADHVAKKSTNLISSKTALKNLISLQQLNKRALSTTFQQHRNNWLENQQKQMQLKDQQQRQSQQIQHQLHTSHQLQSQQQLNLQQQQPFLQQPTPQQQQQPTLQQQQPSLQQPTPQQQQQPTLQQQQPSLQQQRPFTDFQQQHLHHQQSLLFNTPHTTSDTSVVNLLAT